MISYKLDYIYRIINPDSHRDYYRVLHIYNTDVNFEIISYFVDFEVLEGRVFMKLNSENTWFTPYVVFINFKSMYSERLFDVLFNRLIKDSINVEV
jgi:hypothetical protein